MKSLVTIVILLLASITLEAQRQATVWYFGNEAGLDFSSGAPISLSNGNMIAEAGCSSICNKQGALQFYTNGMQVMNRNHLIMENGDSLYGSQYINQNSVIVPQPFSDDSVYYLFTINRGDSISRFSYSVINMNMANGMGKLIARNDTLSRNVVEKIAAVQHCNGRDFWIITHDFNTVFYAVLLTQNGVTDIVKSTTGMKVKADIGYLKISPAGDQLVLPVNNEEVLAQIFDFNNKTGKITKPVTLYRKADNTYCFGFEFSPDANMLYMTTGGRKFELWQFDLRNRSEQELNTTAIRIANGNNFAMQLAPDNKIYIASENSTFLNAINIPNEKGPACSYQKKAVLLTHGNSFKGLPNFTQSMFYRPSIDSRNFCLGDTTMLTFNHENNIDSLIWRFNPGEDNPSIHGKQFTINRPFHDTLSYMTSVSAYHCGIADTAVTMVKITAPPFSLLPDDTILCNGCTYTLDPGIADTYLWNDGSTGRFFSVSQPGAYSIEMANNSCTSFDSIKVTLPEPSVFFPNAFTPNDDGVNDQFNIVTTVILLDFNMEIYDRQGRLLFATKDQNKGWNGKYHNTDCNTATYYYKVSYAFYNEIGLILHKNKKGMVTLIR